MAAMCTIALCSLSPSYLLAQSQGNTLVGQKLSDSTGSISISASALQQQVFPNVDALKTGYSIAGSLSLKVGAKSYILFSAAGPASDTLIVAVELSMENNSFYINLNKGQGVHTCKKEGSCNSCLFVYNRLEKVIGCSCADFPSNLDWECKHRFEKTKTN